MEDVTRTEQWDNPFVHINSLTSKLCSHKIIRMHDLRHVTLPKKEKKHTNPLQDAR